MKHWVTGEEIGEGFQYDEEEHEMFQYNTPYDVYYNVTNLV